MSYIEYGFYDVGVAVAALKLHGERAVDLHGVKRKL
jgi:hypothetical protein